MKPELKADVNLTVGNGHSVQGHTPETDELEEYGADAKAYRNHARKLETQRDRLLAVNKTLVEALEAIVTFANTAEAYRNGISQSSPMINQARAALKAGKV